MRQRLTRELKPLWQSRCMICQECTMAILTQQHAVHTDLYDKKDVIPFEKIEKFLKKHLK